MSPKRPRSWTDKAKLYAEEEPARGGILREDPQYKPQTRVQQPSNPQPLHALQQAPQQGRETASYYTHYPQSPFLPNSNSQPLQYGSQPPMSQNTFTAPYQGYSPLQGRSAGRGSRRPPRNPMDASVGPQYADSSSQYERNAVDESRQWPEQSTGQSNWPSQQRTLNDWQASRGYDGPPAPPSYNEQNNYALQGRLTEYGHSYASAPEASPRRHTRLRLPGWEWEWETGGNA
jgi:hypothetical protein